MTLIWFISICICRIEPIASIQPQRRHRQQALTPSPSQSCLLRILALVVTPPPMTTRTTALPVYVYRVKLLSGFSVSYALMWTLWNGIQQLSDVCWRFATMQTALYEEIVCILHAWCVIIACIIHITAGDGLICWGKTIGKVARVPVLVVVVVVVVTWVYVCEFTRCVKILLF